MALSFECRTTILAPARQVFVALSEPEVLSEWMPHRVTLERLTPAPTQAGSRWRQVRRFPNGNAASDVYEVVARDSPHTLELRVEPSDRASTQGELHLRYTFESPQPDVTELRLHVELTGLGSAAGLLAKLFLGGMQKAFEADLAALKVHLEQSVH